jgi:hypothetical protein
LVGVLRPASLMLTGEVGVGGKLWKASVGGLWSPPQTIDLGPGVVHERLLSGFVRGCYSPWRYGVLRSDVCAGGMMGLATAEGEGYSRDERHSRPWLALPVDVQLSGRRGVVGWELDAGAFATLRRADFAVDGVGVAYHSPPIGVMLSLRAFAVLPW